MNGSDIVVPVELARDIDIVPEGARTGVEGLGGVGVTLTGVDG
jgi:hypothetical protein